MADGVGEIYHVPKKIGAKIQKINLKTYLPIITKVSCENSLIFYFNLSDTSSVVISLTHLISAHWQ